MAARRAELRRVATAAGGLAFSGLALLLAPDPTTDPPVVDVLVAPPVTVRSADDEDVWTRTWRVTTSVTGEDADVLVQLRLAQVPLAPARVTVRLCPGLPEPEADTCSAVLLDSASTSGRYDLGRIGTIAGGTGQQTLVSVTTPKGDGRAPRLTVNATPCAPARSADLWHRRLTRPLAPTGTPLGGLDPCVAARPPWRLLGGGLLGSGVLVPAAALLAQRVRRR